MWTATTTLESIQCEKMIFNPNATSQELAILGTIRRGVIGGRGTCTEKGLFIFGYSPPSKGTACEQEGDSIAQKYKISIGRNGCDLCYSPDGKYLAYMIDHLKNNLHILKKNECGYMSHKWFTVGSETGLNSKNEKKPGSCISYSKGAFTVKVEDSEFPYGESIETFEV